jgi:hypothetical protein
LSIKSGKTRIEPLMKRLSEPLNMRMAGRVTQCAPPASFSRRDQNLSQKKNEEDKVEHSFPICPAPIRCWKFEVQCSMFRFPSSPGQIGGGPLLVDKLPPV